MTDLLLLLPVKITQPLKLFFYLPTLSTPL
jgi:hypothetical protein